MRFTVNNILVFPVLNFEFSIGPVDLTVGWLRFTECRSHSDDFLGTLSPGQSSSIPTVTDNLFRQGTIPSNMVSISFEPPSSAQDANGELTWGGTDSSKFTGEITYTSVLKQLLCRYAFVDPAF